MKNVKKMITLSVAAWMVLATGISASIQTAHADENDGAYLDPPYTGPKGLLKKAPTIVKNLDGSISILEDRNPLTAPNRNDVLKVIGNQTPVRSQASRGTCSIFSATAALESMLIIEKRQAKSLDLSEEWLEYIIMRTQGSEGSSTFANFRALQKFGSPKEALLPYLGETWTDLNFSSLANTRCSKAAPELLQHCLLGHRDPKLLLATDAELTGAGSVLRDVEFAAARTDAFKLRDKTLKTISFNSFVSTTDDVKNLLDKGIPVVLDIDFYYGAWNHSKASVKNIGRDLDAWSKGLVGYPEFGSVDFEESRNDPAGHSVVLVGYDDERELVTEVKMKDGTMKKHTYKGVYFFKNSWGTGNFSTANDIAGKIFPGYGIITQKYANEYGGFFQLQFGPGTTPRPLVAPRPRTPRPDPLP